MSTRQPTTKEKPKTSHFIVKGNRRRNHLAEQKVKTTFRWSNDAEDFELESRPRRRF